jgi:hypothetical protein
LTSRWRAAALAKKILTTVSFQTTNSAGAKLTVTRTVTLRIPRLWH